MEVKFPFRALNDECGRDLSIKALTAPFRNDEDLAAYHKYLAEGSVIGFTSYQSWPFYIDNPHEDRYVFNHDHDYFNMIEAWCHCFDDDAGEFLVPGIDISESDFVMVDYFKTSEEKTSDFVYVCLPDNEETPQPDGWQAWNRNWDLAQRCFNRMGDLKGVLVGREKLDCPWNVTTTGFLPWDEYKEIVASTRFLFVPNLHDASPRVITEALAMNVPVLLNENILGGYKYVNDNTGRFFKDEWDFPMAVIDILTSEYEPRRWIHGNYGRLPTGRRLRDFLAQHLKPENVKEQLSKCEMVFFK